MRSTAPVSNPRLWIGDPSMSKAWHMTLGILAIRDVARYIIVKCNIKCIYKWSSHRCISVELEIKKETKPNNKLVLGGGRETVNFT